MQKFQFLFFRQDVRARRDWNSGRAGIATAAAGKGLGADRHPARGAQLCSPTRVPQRHGAQNEGKLLVSMLKFTRGYNIKSSQTEMLSLKQDNERLQRIVTSKSLTSSQSSLPMPDNGTEQFPLSESTSPTAAGM